MGPCTECTQSWHWWGLRIHKNAEVINLLDGDVTEYTDANAVSQFPITYRVEAWGGNGYKTAYSSSITMAPVSSGWNLASVPLIQSDWQKTMIWPSADSRAFAYEGRYVAKDQLASGLGYWVKFDPAEVIQYYGRALQVAFAPVQDGWNLIGSVDHSIPVAEVTPTPEGIIESQFFDYTGSYVPVDQLQIGRAYWVKTTTPGTLQLGNPPAPQPPQQPESQSPPPYPVVLSQPSDGATNLYPSLYLYWNPVESTQTYQVQVSTNSTFDPLQVNDSLVTALQKQVSLSYGTTYYWRVRARNSSGWSTWSSVWNFTTMAEEPPPPDPCEPYSSVTAMDQFTINDATGVGQILFFRNRGRGLEKKLQTDEEMPPEPIGNIFHARFGSGKYVESVPVHGKKTWTEFPIKLKDVTYPLTLSWDRKNENNIKYILRLPGTNSKIPLTDLNGSFVIGNSAGGGNDKFIVEAQSSDPCEPPWKVSTESPRADQSVVPSSTELFESYPNPFNPVTVIQYSLAEDGNQVKLIVYNTLGQEVATLVNETQSAGYKSVSFNASNLPSGVYFYRLTAGSFTDIKKMLLVK